MNLEAFVTTARGLRAPVRLRAAHVDLDYLFDADPGQQERNLDRLLDRIKAMGINRVFLQAFADPDGDGVADAVYFPNRHLPVRADLFNRVAWQLRTRSGVQVFAWMPVLAFELPDPADNRRLAVLAADGSQGEHYHRLSPFHPEARRTISDIYADLGRSSHFAGILFHDDGFLTDSEDASPAALAFYARYWPEQTGAATAALADGRPPAADAGADAFARAKTRHLIAFTEELADVLRREQPALVTARNLYARAVIQPASERWFAQNLRMFLDHYDYTAVMAMPYLEQAANPERWLARLVERVARWPNALERTLFEVQTRDWRDGKPLDAATLTRHLNLLLDAGVRHIAWYPDDFVTGHPDLEVIRATVSLSDHPAVPE
jgi:biofilm PGA synthesis lipoprotein PgaB